MDYRTLAQSILQSLPPSQLQPKQTSRQSDDDRIAQIVWGRMQLEISLNKPSAHRSMLLI